MTRLDFPRWGPGWRDEAWSHLDQEWDLIIIGGGITGGGLLNEAGCRGWKALLVEEKDFAWGTSSRSSKLVHGGMRYIKQGKVRLTRSMLLERDTLLKEVPGLVDRLPFLLPTYSLQDRWLYSLGVTLYDVLRRKRKSWSWLPPEDVRRLLPGVAGQGLRGGFRYGDAVTEDARLVLRVIREGVAKGGMALSYVRAGSLLREGGRVVGVELHDTLQDRRIRLRSRIVVNAAGAAGDEFREVLGGEIRLRPLRGAHLVIPRHRLPLELAVSFRHPDDGRHLYLLPWEGTTLVGATDLDHGSDLNLEPRATSQEVAYLLTFVNRWFPHAKIIPRDLLSTFAGVRPVLRTGRKETHKESRDSLFCVEAGLATVISGKLTGFRDTVQNAAEHLARQIPSSQGPKEPVPFFSPGALREADDLSPDRRERLLGRYGRDAGALVAAAGPGELEEIPGTSILWAELRWGARAEGVMHLEDLLLRRVRLALVLPEGGREALPRVREVCQAELKWDDRRWEEEESRYLAVIRECYGVPRPSGTGLPA